MSGWVELFTQYLDTPLPVHLITPTEDTEQIRQLNKTPEWRLKGILAQITLKLFVK
jgi:hypothetical protein